MEIQLPITAQCFIIKLIRLWVGDTTYVLSDPIPSIMKTDTAVYR